MIWNPYGLQIIEEGLIVLLAVEMIEYTAVAEQSNSRAG